MTDDQTDDQTILDGHAVEAADLPDWRLLFSHLRARFRTGDFVTGARLVAGVTEAAEAMNHHPDLDLRYPYVDVALTSHDVGGVTGRDVRLARQIGELAADLGAEADPGALSTVEIGLDTHDKQEIKAFWAALLGLEPSDDDDRDLIDPDGRVPTLWFQSSDDPGETPRQRFHFDVRVPPEEANARVHAALEAGGTLVSDESAPAYWVLADAQGNRACVTTWRGRD